MKRRVFLSGLFAGIAIAGAALAQDIVASVVAQLQSQGFGSITQETTLLGRVRILAVRGDGVREIIINPSTGEILRDLWSPSSGVTSLVEIIDEGKPPASGGDTGGSTGTGDDGGTTDDEGTDDGGGDDGDDNSGSGSGSDDGDDDSDDDDSDDDDSDDDDSDDDD